MGISGIPAIPMIITCLLQGILCDTGIPRTFYGGKICSVELEKNVYTQNFSGYSRLKVSDVNGRNVNCS